MHPRLNELLANAGVPGSAVEPDESSTATTPPDSTAVIQGATDKIGLLQTVTQTNIDSITANTDALTAGSAAKSETSSSSLMNTIGSSASGLLNGGGLLSGILDGGGLIGDALSGLASLFSGSSSTPTFTQYQAPEAQHFDLAASGGETGDAVNSDTGQPRVAPITEQGLSGIQALNSLTGGRSETGYTGSAGSQQVTVNIQAMDSQSFMDRSSDIAQAVRSAMLNMNSLNDVISDL